MVDDATNATKPKRRVPRAIKALLFASLALNLLVVGTIVGVVANGGPRDRDSSRTQSHAAPFVRALERDDRRAIGKEIRSAVQNGRGGENAGQRRRQANAEVLALLRAQTFDAARFVALMEQQSELAKVAARAGSEAMAEHFSKMTAAERSAYADRVEELMAKGPKRFGPRDASREP